MLNQSEISHYSQPGNTARSAARSNRLPDVLTAAREAGGADIFVSAIESLGWADRFRADGPMTFFIPADMVFRAMPTTKLRRLSCERYLRQTNLVMRGHILDLYAAPGIWRPSDGSTAVQTLSGRSLKVVREPNLRVNGAEVLKADIDVSQGVLHILRSLFPVC